MEGLLSWWQKALVTTAYMYTVIFFSVLSTISLFHCSFSIQCSWKVNAVLVKGKAKWQVGWCLLCSCLKHICTNKEWGLLKGHWTWGLLSVRVFIVKTAKRLFSLILAHSYPKVLRSWEIPCKCCGVFSWVIFLLFFHRALWFERGFSWLPASCVVKKICNLNRHEDFCCSNVRAWTKISIRLAFTSVLCL